MSVCINSGQHIREGEVLVEVPGFTCDCPMCGLVVPLDVCTHGGTIGFHFKSHEVLQ